MWTSYPLLSIVPNVMSEKWNKYKQVKLTPDNEKALEKIAAKEPFKPSINAMVNRIVYLYCVTKNSRGPSKP